MVSAAPPAQHQLVGEQPAISLLLERVDQDPKAGDRFTSLAVAPGESIASIKLRVARRGAFTSRHRLVLGDRQLLDSEHVGDLAANLAAKTPSGSSFLHIIIRLADIESVSIGTSMQRTLSFSTSDDSPAPIRRSKSALTALLEERSDRDSPEACRSPSSLAVAARSASLPPDGVVHLVIHPSAKVGWRHQAGSKLELSISADATAQHVAEELDLPEGEHQLLYNGQVLGSTQSLASYGILSDTVLELVPVGRSSPESGSPPLSSPSHQLYSDFQAAKAGLASGLRPRLAASGSGGSYFLSNAAGKNVAVLKPADEEPFGVACPRHMGTSPDGFGLRRGIRPGEGAVREVAAYVLDHDHFSGVPPTAMVSLQSHLLPNSFPGASNAKGVKVGSLQQFIHSDTDCEEQGPSAFSVKEVHKIAVLDIRLCNADRNGSNILAKRNSDGQWILTPIDHAYSLPSSFQDIAFEWMAWPQALVPFDDETLAYIAKLDVEADLALLEAHSLQLRSECKRVMRVSYMLLQMAAARGLSPYAIGSILSRQLMQKSPLEKMHAVALQLSRSRAMASSAASDGGGYSFLQPVASRGCGGRGQDAGYFSVLRELLEEYLDGSGQSYKMAALPRRRPATAPAELAAAAAANIAGNKESVSESIDTKNEL